ncbi:MAG TPA: response regulator [Thermoanaerobaculia bacterium]|nr:response regulator [Thermoanaerobaculia bacterium]
MPKKILLADDSITIQKVVELTFSDGDYEVTAVNNGAKAVQKLAEMRPDIILSDIIMPEKNGYEVCEYVKSNPEFRNIPVVLLTGTFEPFDPDRAEKAGCDAVVTKPFESQSLIHKVEELISQAQQNASAAAAAPAAESPSPWMDDSATSAPDSGSAFTTASGAFPSASETGDAFTHDSDIFGAAPAPQATTEMPFEVPADPFGAPPPAEEFSGETRAFPRISFEELQKMSTPEPAPEIPPAVPAAPEPSPWDEPAADAFSGETRAFTKMSFDDFAASAPTPDPEPAPQAEPESPFGAPPPVEEFSGETRAFPRMSFEELQQMSTPAPAPEPEPEPPTPEPSPWDQPAAAASPFGAEDDGPAFGGETRAFPKMSFDDLQSLSSAPLASAPTPEQPLEPTPWGEPSGSHFDAPASPFDAEPEAPAFGGETRAFPKLSFDDFQQMSAPEPEPTPEPEAPTPSPWEATPAADAPIWSPTAETSAFDTPSTESFSTAAAVPFTAEPTGEAMPEDLPFATETTSAPEPIPAEEPSWSPIAAAEAQAEPEEPAVPPPALAPEASPAMPIASRGGELTDDQIDRIARRVVELMSDQVVRNIAWEVIPDLAEMVVKERIRQLEAEG